MLSGNNASKSNVSCPKMDDSLSVIESNQNEICGCDYDVNILHIIILCSHYMDKKSFRPASNTSRTNVWKNSTIESIRRVAHLIVFVSNLIIVLRIE